MQGAILAEPIISKLAPVHALHGANFSEPFVTLANLATQTSKDARAAAVEPSIVSQVISQVVEFIESRLAGRFRACEVSGASTAGPWTRNYRAHLAC